MYFSHIFLKVPFNYVLLSRLLYSAKGISATDILPVICLGSDVALNKSKFIIIIIIMTAGLIRTSGAWEKPSGCSIPPSKWAR